MKGLKNKKASILLETVVGVSMLGAVVLGLSHQNQALQKAQSDFNENTMASINLDNFYNEAKATSYLSIDDKYSDKTFNVDENYVIKTKVESICDKDNPSKCDLKQIRAYIYDKNDLNTPVGETMVKRAYTHYFTSPEVYFNSTNIDTSDVIGVKYAIQGAKGLDGGKCSFPEPTIKTPGGEISGVPNDIQVCQTNYFSGGQSFQYFYIYLGNVSGEVNFWYQMLRQPDQLTAYYDGKQVWGTGGLVSWGNYTPDIPGAISGQISTGKISWYYEYDPNVPPFLVLALNAPENGTLWGFQVGCPKGIASQAELNQFREDMKSKCPNGTCNSNGGEGQKGGLVSGITDTLDRTQPLSILVGNNSIGYSNGGEGLASDKCTLFGNTGKGGTGGGSSSLYNGENLMAIAAGGGGGHGGVSSLSSSSTSTSFAKTYFPDTTNTHNSPHGAQATISGSGGGGAGYLGGLGGNKEFSDGFGGQSYGFTNSYCNLSTNAGSCAQYGSILQEIINTMSSENISKTNSTSGFAVIQLSKESEATI